MKNKQELAQSLSEHLDRVDESLLQHAHQIDTAEKFHALDGKQKKIRFTKDRPVTTFHRATAVAVSLAVALALAFGVFALAQIIPGLWGPDPTNPHLTQPPGTTQTDPTTEPTQTTVPTEPTEPTDPTEPIIPNPSGTCGENATWEFDPATGTLTISGGSLRVLLARRIVKFTLMSILTGVVRTAVVFWLPTYLSQYLGFPTDTAALLFTVSSFVISMTTFVAIFLYERLGRSLDLTMLVSFIASAVRASISLATS